MGRMIRFLAVAAFLSLPAGFAGAGGIKQLKEYKAAVSHESGSWAGRHIRGLGHYLDSLSAAGVDTSFFSLPKYGWKATVSASFAGLLGSVRGSDIPGYGDISGRLRTSLNGQTSVTLGYRGLSLGYSFGIARGYSRDFNLSYMRNSWGLEYRNHLTDGLHGRMDASLTPDDLPVRKDDIRLKATIINGYYVFNSRHYSLPAAMGQTVVQKRSSGSVTAYAVFLSSSMVSREPAVSAMLGGLNKIELYQAALGLGYGYNFTPNRGRLLLHASAAPLLVFFNKSLMTADVNFPLPSGGNITTEVSKEVLPRHKYFVTFVARASVAYNFSDHIFASAALLVNDIDFNSTTGLKLAMHDWILRTTLGLRF